jgi:hypothetical protein
VRLAGNGIGRADRHVATLARLLAPALAVSLLGLAAMFGAGVSDAAGVGPTMSPYPPGRHVFDYGNLMSASSRSLAENLAGDIEAAGGGRVVVYTADLQNLPAGDDIMASWQVDGLLLSGWSSVGSARVGKSLESMLPADAVDCLDSTSATSGAFESWATSTLARAAGFLAGRHVFDGSGLLTASDVRQLESAATSLGTSTGANVYVDVARGRQDDPYGTAFSNGFSLSSRLERSIVIALAVSATTMGGYVASDSEFWSSYSTGEPWVNSTIDNRTVAGGDQRNALVRAVYAVGLPLDPEKAMRDAAGAVANDVTRIVTDYASNPTNQRWTVLGLLLALLSVVGFKIDRWRRRREAGYTDDDSVMLPAPPAEMTPALAALVAAPLDTTRAVTAALLDLAAHGFIAFYQSGPAAAAAALLPGGVGPGGAAHGGAAHGGVHVVSDSGAATSGPIRSSATERPLGEAETELLDGLRSWAGASGAGRSGGVGAGVVGVGADFATLRPLLERTGERLEAIAGQHGWLDLRPSAASRFWIAWSVALLVLTAAMALLWQPIAAIGLWYAALQVLPPAFHMPLPIRTPEGLMTAATVEAYRRTLKRALASEPGTVPGWLANAEEAALWGYAWGLEGEVQAFVARNVAAALDVDHAEADEAMARTAGLRGMGAALDTACVRGSVLSRVPIPTRSSGSWTISGRRPVGLDTAAIGRTIGVLGPEVARGSGRATGGDSVART